jgi:hypothetical protein
MQVIINGEPSVQLSSDNFQAIVSRTVVTDLANSVIAPPLTELQQAYSSSIPTVKLTSSGVNAAGFQSQYAKYALISYAQNPNPSSSSIKTSVLKFLSFSGSSSSRRLTSSYRNSPLQLNPSFYVSLPFSSTQNFNFSMDINSPSFNKLNPNFVLPECTIYSNSIGDYVPCGLCNISSYNNYNVTFGCSDVSLLFDSSSSRRLHEDGEESIDYFSEDRDLASTSLSSYGNQFASIVDIYIAPTSSPTGVPTSTLLLPQILNVNAYGFSRKEIRASVSLTAKFVFTTGFLYCTATRASSVTLAYLQTYGVVTSFKNMSQTIGVKLSNLDPSQTYNVFCGITTTKGYASSLAKVLATKVSAKTLCCREVSFSSTPSFVYGDLSR